MAKLRWFHSETFTPQTLQFRRTWCAVPVSIRRVATPVLFSLGVRAPGLWPFKQLPPGRWASECSVDVLFPMFCEEVPKRFKANEAGLEWLEAQLDERG